MVWYSDSGEETYWLWRQKGICCSVYGMNIPFLLLTKLVSLYKYLFIRKYVKLVHYLSCVKINIIAWTAAADIGAEFLNILRWIAYLKYLLLLFHRNLVLWSLLSVSESILVFPVTPRSVCVYVWLVALSTLWFSYWIFVAFLLCHVHLTVDMLLNFKIM